MSVATGDSITADVKRALDEVFFPLDIKVVFRGTDVTQFIGYDHPFNPDRYWSYGIWFKGDFEYPLACTATHSDVKFTVQNADDWINHAPVFVCRYHECVELMDKFTARKK